MRITRGPASGEDEDYKLVDTLEADKIEKLTSRGILHFNITSWEAKKRASACYVEFEKSDIPALLKGLAVWMNPDLDGYSRIKSVMYEEISDGEKLEEIKKIISSLRIGY